MTTSPAPDRVTALYDAIDAFQRTHRTGGGLQHAQIRALLAEHLDRALPRPTADQPPADRATVLHEAADHAYRIARRLDDQEHDERAQGAWDVENTLRAKLRRMADETQPATATEGPRCVCGHPVRLHHEDACLHTACGCTDSLEISALPEALEAVLTKRYTELGNPFSEMRRREQGPDGWPASRPVGPHHVAEALRDLLRRAADDGSGLCLPDHAVNEEETPDAEHPHEPAAEARQDGAQP